MHTILKIGAVASASLALLFSVAAYGQQGNASATTAAINAVIAFRTEWLGDATRFDGCSVYTALGRPADFPAGIGESVRPALDRTTQPCASDSTRVVSSWPLNFVQVDSISLRGDSTARVFLSVRKQTENVHFETYEVKGLAGPTAYVHTMTVWGIMRDYRVPPGRRPGN